MDASIYVLDANVFIEAARSYYAFDLAPGFWESLVNLAETGRILSIDRIRGDLERGKDELLLWANNDFDNYFVSTDEDDVIAGYREIITWVQNNNQFSDAAKSEFAESADGWLMAYAKAKGHIVVTREVLKPEIKRRVPIPNICEALGIAYIDPFIMLRRLGVRLVS